LDTSNLESDDTTLPRINGSLSPTDAASHLGEWNPQPHRRENLKPLKNKNNYNNKNCQARDLGTHRNRTKEVNNLLFKNTKIFSGAFEKLRKATITFVMYVCPSARMEQFGSHCSDFN
jgi:hypothetical protein